MLVNLEEWRLYEPLTILLFWGQFDPQCTFTFMHLADAFIQSNLQCIQAIHFDCLYVCSLGIEPTTFALLTQCSTTESQEQLINCLKMWYTIYLFCDIFIFIKGYECKVLLQFLCWAYFTPNLPQTHPLWPPLTPIVFYAIYEVFNSVQY